MKKFLCNGYLGLVVTLLWEIRINVETWYENLKKVTFWLTIVKLFFFLYFCAEFLFYFKSGNIHQKEITMDFVSCVKSGIFCSFRLFEQTLNLHKRIPYV